MARGLWSAWGKPAYRILEETWSQYGRARGEMLAAGLAFFTLLSIAPLIIIAVAIAGLVLGQGPALEEALRITRSAMGNQAAETVQGWVKQATDSGTAASLVGFVLALYAASRLGEQLRVALNQLWNVDERAAAGFRASVRSYLQRRLYAFVWVLTAGPLLLVVFASRALLSALELAPFADSAATSVLIQAAQLVFSWLAVAGVAAVIFRLVPDVRVGWPAITRGALVTSTLFNVGNWLVGLYLGHAAVGQAYGAAGSVVVVLMWAYFSAQMFLFGAELTRVCSSRE
ncbi:MAG: YihY/virulence factor BrkB family protein [Myxococcales bacterium]